MKAVLFVCLLSLSLCLSVPTSPPDTHPVQATAAIKPDEKAPSSVKEDKSAQSKNATEVVQSTEKPAHQDASPPATNKENKADDAKPQDNKTDKTPKTNENKFMDPPKNETMTPGKNNESVINEAAKKAEDTNAESKDKTGAKNDADVKKTEEESKAAGKDKEGETTTQKAVTPKSTEAPKDTTVKPTVAARSFDSPSFFGGIVLTLGILAIGFIGFKYYKNQTERNYHTL